MLSPLATLAHHSVSVFFDQGTVSELDGTITRVLWRNPHVGFVLLANTEAGEEEWELESGSLGILERRGITQDSFAVGEPTSVEAGS